MIYIHNKELFAKWQSKSMETGIVFGEFTVDGIDFYSDEEVEFANGSHWSTLRVWADYVLIYEEEHELEPGEVEDETVC